jgi:hypothetical protein
MAKRERANPNGKIRNLHRLYMEDRRAFVRLWKDISRKSPCSFDNLRLIMYGARLPGPELAEIIRLSAKDYGVRIIRRELRPVAV